MLNDTLPKKVHRQKALFSRDMPFTPQGYLMLYFESCANEVINGYFHKQRMRQGSRKLQFRVGKIKSCTRHGLGIYQMKMGKLLMGTLIMTLSVNLAYAQFRPTVFTPVEYKPQSTDYSILERSFQAQENRSNMAYQKYSELAQLIGEKRQRISNDRETLEWFSNNIDTKLKDVKVSLNVGDYQGAIESATRAIGDINSNTELIRRIQTYEEYQNIVRYIQERTDLSYQQKQEWMELYKYKFVPILNAEGKVIGAYDWKEIGGPNYTRVVLP